MPSNILDVQEQPDGRSGGINSAYQRNYTRVFDVVAASPKVGALAVYLDPRIPQLGQPYTNGLSIDDEYYEEDLGSFVGDVAAEAIGGAEGGCVAWKVTVKYVPWNPAVFGSDPTLWPLRVTFGGERTERVVDFDRDGWPIRNSAGDRFGDPVTVPDHINTLVITRNERVVDFNPTLASLYSNTTNMFAWNGFAPGHCLMGLITTSDEKYDSNGNVWYYTVTYPVMVSRKPWRKDLLDQGFNELPDPYYADSRPRPIMEGGQPISDPVALDGAGHRLPINGDPVTLSFEVHDVADWAGLNINLAVRLGAV